MLAVGGKKAPTSLYSGVKAELYDNQANKWTSVEDYQFAEELFRFASLYVTGNFYVIGGQSRTQFGDHFFRTIAKLDTTRFEARLFCRNFL